MLRADHHAAHQQMGAGDIRYASEVADLDASAWSRVDGGAGGGTVTVSPVSGFAARLTTNNGITAYVVARRAIAPVVLAATDVITFEVNVPDASTTRAITARLLVNTSGKQFSITGFEMWHPGRNTFSFVIGDMTAAGGALTTDQFEYVQVDLTGPAYTYQLQIDVGRVWIGGSTRLPHVCITWDSNYEKVHSWAFKHMKKLGIPGNIYIRGEHVGAVGGYMSLAQVQEVVANGWELGLYSYWMNWGANNYDVQSVALSQSVGAGANFTINGTVATGGVAIFDVPRYVTAMLSSGNDNTNSYLITGTDAGGGAYSEHIRGCSGNVAKVYTKGKFKTVSSVVSRQSTAGNVSIGSAYTADEFIRSSNAGQQWLQQNGFPPALDWAFPLGEYNNDSETWLLQQGFKTARTVTIGATIFHDAAPGADPNYLFVPCAVTIGDSSSAASLKSQIDLSVARGLDFFIIGHLNDSAPPSESELKASLAYLASLHRAGTIRICTFSQFRAARGIV